jgi:hypothetical protein
MYLAISMAYDEDLADRIRRLLKAEKGLSEMAMFGGLALQRSDELPVQKAPGRVAVTHQIAGPRPSST